MIVKRLSLSVALAPLLLAGPVLADDTATPPQEPPRLTAWEASRTRANDDMVSTGVARARDRLDSATSTSSMADVDVLRIGNTAINGIFRTIPGIRAEAGSGDILGNYTIRGLPMVGTGAKYLQFQEDGLPVLQFGDILALTPDYFMRFDFSTSQIESIRGGSASTFASNAPGGVINLISHTGEVEGGSVQVLTGVDYDTQRVDFSYGGHLSDTLRFHVGGFYREGEGVREAGFDGNRGGQIRFNVTKDFEGGFIRLEGKLLDDRVTVYGPGPVRVTGSNDDPSFSDIEGFSILEDTVVSRNLGAFPYMTPDGQLAQSDVQDGNRAQVRSIGFQTRFNVGGLDHPGAHALLGSVGRPGVRFPAEPHAGEQCAPGLRRPPRNPCLRLRSARRAGDHQSGNSERQRVDLAVEVRQHPDPQPQQLHQ